MLLWKRIKLEDFDFPKVVDYKKDYLICGENPSGVILNKTKDNLDRNNMDLNLEEINGVGEKFVSFARDSYNSGISLYVPKKTKIDKPVRVEFNMDNENPIVIDNNMILVEEDSEVTLIFDYSSSDDVEAFHNGLTKVIANRNSVVNIIKIQRINDKSPNFDSNIALTRENGVVNWVTIEIGANISGSNYTTYLNNQASESNLSSIYIGDGNRKLDLEYTMVHKGARSISNIESRGVLMDNAKKVFRGNLDFKRGARRANGVEEEFVILLDPTVKSDSIPALLCEEDDVQGEHAASAGQIDKSKLFYLMSRGLSERESKKLIVEASFRPIIDKIPFEDLQNLISQEISRRLING